MPAMIFPIRLFRKEEVSLKACLLKDNALLLHQPVRQEEIHFDGTFERIGRRIAARTSPIPRRNDPVFRFLEVCQVNSSRFSICCIPASQVSIAHSCMNFRDLLVGLINGEFRLFSLGKSIIKQDRPHSDLLEGLFPDPEKAPPPSSWRDKGHRARGSRNRSWHRTCRELFALKVCY